MKKQQGIPAAAYRLEKSQQRKAVWHKWVWGAHSGSKENKSPSAVPQWSSRCGVSSIAWEIIRSAHVHLATPVYLWNQKRWRWGQPCVF